MRIFFAGGGTGGHLYPALAIARSMVRQDPSIKPMFIGAKRGIEKDILPGSEFQHVLLDLHPLYRQKVWENWRTLFGMISAWRRIHRLSVLKPDVIVGTGGYAAVAALSYAVVRRIPIVQHAGDSFPGLTARMFARFSKMMFLGFPEAEEHLSHRGKTQYIDSGNPIEPPPNPLPDRAAARRQWGFPERGGVVLLIYGGSQGSEAINKVVDNWIARGLPEGLNIIWATGPKNIDRYRKRDSDRVKVRGYLDPIRDAYAASDIALARAGAMTTSELCAWGIPMVLVPLPNSAGDHQSDNAKALAAAGAAVNLRQARLDVASLDGTVRELVADPAKLSALAEGARARGRPYAADMIAEQILSLARGGAIFRAPNATTR